MNYQKVYDSLVMKAKLRETLQCYSETHHIIPRSLGGEDTPENLVVVTAREHFILHCLLTKIHLTGEANSKMMYAFMLMKGSSYNQKRYINARLYDQAKVRFAELQRHRFLGVPKSEEHKLNISKAMLGRVTKPETKQKQAEAAKTRKRKPFSEEYKKRMSEKMKQVKGKNAVVAEMD